MTLQTHIKHTLGLLRAGLWEETPVFPEDSSDLNSMMSFAKMQSVPGILAKAMLADKEYQNNLPKEFRLKLKSLVVTNVMTYNNMTDVIKKASKALNEAGIPHVLLKGHSLAVNYPFPEMRQCGDIDLYVGTENSLATHKVLSQIADRISPESDAKWGKHFSAHFGKIQIEVHRHTCDHFTKKTAAIYKAAAQKGLTEKLSQVELDGVQVNTPSTDFNAFYIFDHLFDHFLTSGIGLRHLCDWMLFLHTHKDEIDLDYIHGLLKDMKLLEAWQVFGCVLVKHLGLPEEEFPFYAESDKADKVFSFVLSDGNFGKTTGYYTRRSSNYLLTKMNAFWCHITRGVKMIGLFPGQVLRHFYGILVNYLQHLSGDIKRKLNHGR